MVAPQLERNAYGGYLTPTAKTFVSMNFSKLFSGSGGVAASSAPSQSQTGGGGGGLGSGLPGTALPASVAANISNVAKAIASVPASTDIPGQCMRCGRGVHVCASRVRVPARMCHERMYVHVYVCVHVRVCVCACRCFHTCAMCAVHACRRTRPSK